MANRISINFNAPNPIEGSGFSFKIYPNFPNMDEIKTINVVFTYVTPLFGNYLSCTGIPVFDGLACITLFNGYYGDYVTTDSSSFQPLVTANNGSPIFDAAIDGTDNGAVTLTLSSVYDLPDVVILPSRSSYIAQSPDDEDTNGAMTTTLYNLRLWKGEYTDYSATSVTYQVEKQRLHSSQERTYINLSPIVRTFFLGDYKNYTNTNYTSGMTLTDSESTWANLEAVNYNAYGTPIASAHTTYFVTDGYASPTDTQVNINNEKIFLSNVNSTIEVPRGTPYRIYYSNNDLHRILINGVDTIRYTGSSTNSAYVNSLMVNTNFSGDTLEYMFQHNYLNNTITFKLKENDCYNPKHTLVFKNKYGYLESMAFNKKSTKQLQTNSTKYKHSILDINGNFDVRENSTKSYNTIGTEMWTLNTDWVNENWNESFKQIWLSEELYLILDDVWYPINKESQNFDYKTHYNDRLIQYTIQVSLSHNEIKNIQ